MTKFNDLVAESGNRWPKHTNDMTEDEIASREQFWRDAGIPDGYQMTEDDEFEFFLRYPRLAPAGFAERAARVIHYGLGVERMVAGDRAGA